MKWCLERLAELKKRAYLARFLVKIDISPEFLSDPGVNDLNSQVTQHLIEIFIELDLNG
jgi:intraflagellar transport protein 81